MDDLTHLPSAPAPAGTSLTALRQHQLPAAAVTFAPRPASRQRPDLRRHAPEDHRPCKAAVGTMRRTATALHCSYVPLTYAQWTAVRAGAADAHPGEPWPAIASLHLLVVTADRQLLLTRRSTTTSFFPGVWSASIEEGLDVPGDRTLAHTADRAVAEELACPPPDRAELLAVAREHDPATGAPWGVVFLAIAALPVAGAQLLAARRHADDAHEHTDAVCAPLPTAGVALSPPDGGRWHPTAPTRLRLLAATLPDPPR